MSARVSGMKYPVKRFKSLKVALKELERFIRNGAHLQSGRPFKRFGGMRSREVLANWLICVVFDAEAGSERFTFTSDPVGGDGIIHDGKTKETWPTEHVMVPQARAGESIDVEASILKAIKGKQKKGMAAYASGKTLVVFSNAGGGARWFPNKVAKRLPATDFAAIWVVGLHLVEDGQYIYSVSELDASNGTAPTWLVHVAKEFNSWVVQRFQ
jgi:hypothetical protein